MGYFRRKLGELGLSSFDIIFLRCFVAAVLFFVFILITNPSSLKLRFADIWCFIGSGVCSLLFFTACYFQAMTVMSLALSAILLYTAPFFVILLSSVLFKEKITKRMLAALLISFAGICLVSGIFSEDSRISTVGILYGLGSGFGYALYTIFSKLALKRNYKSTTISFYSMLFAAIGAALIWGTDKSVNILFSSYENLIFIVVAGIATGFVPYLLYTFGLTKVEGGRASLLASIEPVVATIVGIIAFNEKMSIISISGMILVLSGIAIISLGEK